MTFTEQFLGEAAEILKQIDVAAVERLAATLAECRAGGGRLFILGVGGSAANASHAVNDFRKICGLKPTHPPTTSAN
jgi:D-sedoheptulose 7-phosphate isomerase